jgi:hypothetical protein
MAAPEHDKDYYIIDSYGVIINARGARIITVDSEMDDDEVEDLVAYHYDDLNAQAIIPTLKHLPEVSKQEVDMAELLTNLAGDCHYILDEAERRALLGLRDELPEVYQ